MNKPRKKTKLVSLRLDEDLLSYVRSKNLNLSYTLNHLLRGYLYIQKYDNECPIIGSSDFNPNDVKLDFYSKTSLDCYLES